MKRLIVCFDGTWNNPEQEDNGAPAPTNVFRISNAIADVAGNGVRQVKYYHPGVGGEHKGIAARVLGGAFGAGISRHIQSAYHWLASNYAEGDEIYLYGFSRGAFTVRSLGGMLSRGLLDLSGLEAAEAWKRVKKAYHEGYRKKDATIDDWADADWEFFHNRGAAPIHFIGVWDTVGALGIPDDLEVLNLLDDKDAWQFHDTSLGDHVAHARHAMAIDEMRASFTVTRWSNARQHHDAVEQWFPGVHSDVGGGYADADLSNEALAWMITESRAVGLEFRDGVMEMIHGNPLGKMHNSYKGAFKVLRSRPRNIPAMINDNQDLFHASALRRQQASPIDYPAYHPTRLLEIGESCTVDVYADRHWNSTTVFLEEGCEYTFSAQGEWLDCKDACDWKGTENDKFTAGDIARAVSGIWGKAENMWRHLTHNKSTDFIMTKRIEAFPWFVMVGAIANDGGAEQAAHPDGSPSPHQYVALPDYETTPLRVGASGYLYCFPNDVWSLYGNNHGSIQLTITRVR